MEKYALISTPGLPFKTVPCDDMPSLEWLQKKVGGYIETFSALGRIRDDLVMIVGEEGKINGSSFNIFATAAARLFADGIFEDFLFGTAILLKIGGSDGEELCGLDRNEIDSLLQKFKNGGMRCD